MKKLFVTLCGLTLACSVHAQAPQPQQKAAPAVAAKPAPKPQAAPQPNMKDEKQNPDGPKFQFEGGDTYDFGEIPEGPFGEHTFTFKNVGKEPLIIQEAHGSCGCTIPSYKKDPVKPKKKGEILVRYTTQGRRGPFSKDVIITSNAVTPNGTPYIIHIKGTVVAGSGSTPPPPAPITPHK